MTTRITSDLQALVTGALAASLSATPALALEVEVCLDEQGNYLPEVYVTGLESGTKVRITTETVEP